MSETATEKPQEPAGKPGFWKSLRATGLRGAGKGALVFGGIFIAAVAIFGGAMGDTGRLFIADNLANAERGFVSGIFHSARILVTHLAGLSILAAGAITGAVYSAHNHHHHEIEGEHTQQFSKTLEELQQKQKQPEVSVPQPQPQQQAQVQQPTPQPVVQQQAPAPMPVQVQVQPQPAPAPIILQQPAPNTIIKNIQPPQTLAAPVVVHQQPVQSQPQNIAIHNNMVHNNIQQKDFCTVEKQRREQPNTLARF